MRDPNHPTHPLGLCIKFGVPEEPAHERSHFVLPNFRHNQAVASMPERRPIKICVAGEKRGTSLPAKQNDNLLVLQALAAKVKTNLPHRQPQGLEQQALSAKDVFVEDDQA